MIIIDFTQHNRMSVDGAQSCHAIHITGFIGNDKYLKVINDSTLETEPHKEFVTVMSDEEAGGSVFSQLRWRARLTKNQITELIEVLQFGLEEMEQLKTNKT